MEWRSKNVDAETADRLSSLLGLSRVAATMLVRRGLADPDAARSFLNPSLRDLPSPFLLPDMNRAVERLIQALDRRESVCIYGDYDADGLTATALLADFLERLGFRVSTYVPHRQDEGYGLNGEALETLSRSGVDLVVTVDCGVSDVDAVSRARSLGLDVIVTDHHQPPERLAPALAVVNPKRKDAAFPQRALAGVGVAFFLAGGLRQAMRERGLITTAEQPELAPLLGLVAIGTVADMAPLRDVNRIMVRMGLERLARPDQPGLIALKEVSSLEPGRPLTAREVAFRIAPRINATGRLDSAQPSLELLMTREADRAASLARMLEQTNIQRRRLHAEMVRQALGMIEAEGADPGKAIVLWRQGWHRGVVGLAASKLVERFCRPVILMSVEDGWAHGSGRSVEGFNIYVALDRCRDVLTRFGGHDLAAGLTLEADRVEELKRAFLEIAEREIDDRFLEPALDIEAEVTLDDLEAGLASELARLAPFGEGNPEPVFVLNDLKMISGGLVGGSHLKMTLGQGGRSLDTIGFGLGERLIELGPRVSVAVQRHTSNFRGRTTLGWKVVDIKKSPA
ncbi:MAG: single-stranded-DNA-specific exonuclease RecJ [Proteobacteria bacterium]|nr:single-stranded-DNA-specific exonuclease RecJ [Pseudomonadota bacterium]